MTYEEDDSKTTLPLDTHSLPFVYTLYRFDDTNKLHFCNAVPSQVATMVACVVTRTCHSVAH